MSPLAKIPVAVAAAFLLTFGSVSQATDVATRPLAGTALIFPNLIFGIDDSGSMDWEVMFNTNSGLFWWNAASATGWTATGAPFNPPVPANVSGSFNPDVSYRSYGYLFPLGANAGSTTLDGMQIYAPDLVFGSGVDYNFGNVAPPTAEFAPLRSAAFNPIYYDPAKTYAPWKPRYDSTSTAEPKAKSYGAANVSTPALSHPEQVAAGATLQLNADIAAPNTASSPSVYRLFTMYSGSRVPPGVRYRRIDNSTWSQNTTGADLTLPFSGSTSRVYYVAMGYYPATYWVRENCAASALSTSGCVAAPGGGTLRRYEIRPSVTTYPSGRSYAEELQNYANWFTYYRKRQSMMAASMGELVDGLYGIKIGMAAMNEGGGLLPDANGTNPIRDSSGNWSSYYEPPAVEMLDADSPDYALNGRKMLDKIYRQQIKAVGTPTRNLMRFIGEQYRTRTSSTNSIIKYSCQRNNMLIVTDGFAQPRELQPPSTTHRTSSYFNKDPYRTIPTPSLADLASYYYATNMRGSRTDLTDGMVEPEDINAVNADRNTNLHINTYGLALGSEGLLWRRDAQGNLPEQFPTGAVSWPEPSRQGPEAIDDLWHAAVNGRGRMFTSADASETADALQEALADILNRGGTQTSVGVLNVNLSSEDFAYLASFTSSGWWGDFAAYPIDSSTGLVLNSEPSGIEGENTETSDRVWSAADQIDAMDWTKRTLVTYKGGAGVVFDKTKVTSADMVSSPSVTISGVTDAQVVEYHAGNRALEENPSLLRKRIKRMGAIVNAQPAIDTEEKVAYVPSNDGFVHAIDLKDGKELWAYMPGKVLSRLKAMAKKTWSFATVLDGSPAISRVNGVKYLVGGLGAGGSGFYGIEIENPRGSLGSPMSAEERANKIKWEFPAANASTDLTKNFGTSMGKPLFVRIKGNNPVSAVLLTSGFNTPASGDGRGRVYVINPTDGSFISGFGSETLVTTDTAATPSVGSTSNGEAGLTYLTPFVEPDGTVQYVYGGDLRGNVWRFDLVSTSDRVKKIATLKDANGNTQPIASPVGTANFRGTRVLMVGTGRILGQNDFISQASIDGNTFRVQSMYVMTDTDGSEITSPRTQLVKQDMTAVGTDRRIPSPKAINWNTKRGWFIDLLQGERANTRPFILDGVVVFVTNTPNLDACRASAFLYRLDFLTGDEVIENLAGLKVSYTFTAAGLGVRTTEEGSKIILHRNENDGTGAPQSCIGDGDVITCGNRPQGAGVLQKNSWRQVLREGE